MTIKYYLTVLYEEKERAKAIADELSYKLTTNNQVRKFYLAFDENKNLWYVAGDENYLLNIHVDPQNYLGDLKEFIPYAKEEGATPSKVNPFTLQEFILDKLRECGMQPAGKLNTKLDEWTYATVIGRKDKHNLDGRYILGTRGDAIVITIKDHSQGGTTNSFAYYPQGVNTYGRNRSQRDINSRKAQELNQETLTFLRKQKDLEEVRTIFRPVLSLPHLVSADQSSEVHPYVKKKYLVDFSSCIYVDKPSSTNHKLDKDLLDVDEEIILYAKLWQAIYIDYEIENLNTEQCKFYSSNTLEWSALFQQRLAERGRAIDRLSYFHKIIAGEYINISHFNSEEELKDFMQVEVFAHKIRKLLEAKKLQHEDVENYYRKHNSTLSLDIVINLENFIMQRVLGFYNYMENFMVPGCANLNAKENQKRLQALRGGLATTVEYLLSLENQESLHEIASTFKHRLVEIYGQFNRYSSELNPLGINHGDLLIPVQDIVTGDVYGFQTISGKDCSKKFIKKTRKAGYGYILQNMNTALKNQRLRGLRQADIIAICEGYATALAVEQLLKAKCSVHGKYKSYEVIVAFDCGNLAHMVDIVSKNLYKPEAIIVFADNDFKYGLNPQLKTNKDCQDYLEEYPQNCNWILKDNVGLTKGIYLAKTRGVVAVAPPFKLELSLHRNVEIERFSKEIRNTLKGQVIEPRGTDFYDLLEDVNNHIAKALQQPANEKLLRINSDFADQVLTASHNFTKTIGNGVDIFYHHR